MKFFNSALYQRVTNISFAFILAVSTLTAMGPFLFSERVGAAAAVTVCDAGCDQTNLQAAVDAVDANGTVVIAGNTSVASRVNIAKPLTIDGGGFTLANTRNNTPNNNSNNAAIGINGTSNVAVNNLVIEGTSSVGTHGVNVYVSTNVSFNAVSFLNNDKSGLVVNGSTVTVNNVVTAGNGWHGINVDLGSGVISPAELTVSGTSTHMEYAPDIYVDNVSEPATVIDTNAQYNINNDVLKAGNRVYSIKAAAPTILQPSPEQYFQGTPIVNSWTPVSYTKGVAQYQVEYVYDDGHPFPGAPYRTVDGSTTSRNHVPAESEQGGVTIRVRVIDATGNYGYWSTPVHYTYDSTEPFAPSLASPANGAVVNGASVTQSWSTSDTDVDYYVYESYDDAAASDLRWTEQVNSTSKTANNVANASYWWRVKAVDNAGNESAWSDLWKLTIDNNAPTITVKDSSTGMSGIYSNVSFKLFDANKVDRLTLNGVEKDLTDNKYSDLNNVNPGKFGAVEGDNTLVVYDVAGNSTTFEFTVDVTNPVATILAPSDTDFLNGTVDIRGSVTDDNLWRYYFVIKDSDGATVFDKTVNTDEFSDESLYEWDTTAVADGEYTVFISARDLADNKDGNQTTDGVSTDKITVTVDNTDPAVALNTVSSEIKGTTTFSGTASDANSGLLNDEIRLVFRPIVSGVLQGPEQVYRVAVIGGVWTIDIDTAADLTDGQLYRVIARANDNVGGTYQTSNTATDRADTTVDNTAPIVTMNTVEPVVIGDEATFSGTIDDPTATLVFTLDEVDYTPTVTGSNWQVIVDTDAFDAGDYVATIVATDAAGNSSAADASTQTTLTVEEPVALTPEEEIEGTDTTPEVGPLAVTGTPQIAPSAVLGDTTDTDDGTTNQDDDAEVEGATTEGTFAQADTDTTDGTFLGLAWYWWLLIVGGLAALIGWLIAAARRRSEES